MNQLVERVVAISGRNPYLCYQCGTCSAVCPMADYMDLRPHQIIRLIQLGDNRVVRADALWKCVACHTCIDRCPRNVSPGAIIDALRSMALRKGLDRVNYSSLPDVGKAPSIALVALSRKMTG